MYCTIHLVRKPHNMKFLNDGIKVLESFRKLFLNQWRYFYRKLDEHIEKNYFSIFLSDLHPPSDQ